MNGTQLYGKSIYADPEKYFTEDVMKKLDEAAEKEFTYGQVDSDVSEDI
jgi:hypothetical protein